MSHIVPALTVRFAANATDDQRSLVTAILTDFSTAAIHELSDDEWRVFFRSASDRDAAGATLARDYDVQSLDVADEDWARKSQENLRAIVVGEIVVAPPWDLPSESRQAKPRRSPQGEGARPAVRVVVIEPSTGFGTGHHATTRLCLRALQAIDLHQKTVIDIGTGSGVLAIAAALGGAPEVIAIDNDPDAIAAASANIQRNAAKVDVRLGDVEGLSLPRAEVVLANLTGAMLRRNVATLVALAPAGTLIISGFLVEETADVERAFAPFTASIQREDEDGWGALILRLKC